MSKRQPTPTETPPPIPIDPRLARAADPDVIATIRKLAGLDGGVDHAANASRVTSPDPDPRDKGKLPTPVVQYPTDGQKPPPHPSWAKPTIPTHMHARVRVETGGYVYGGLNLDRAADAMGFDRGGLNSTLLNKARSFYLVSESSAQLAAACQAPDLATAEANLATVRKYRTVLAVALAAIDTATAEVKEALGIE